MHDRDILKSKASTCNDSNDLTQFKKLRNIVYSKIRLAKQAYIIKTVLNEYTGDSRKTWQTINDLTSLKSKNLNLGNSGNISESKWGINNQSNWAFERI